jgi:hypothetical protein
MRTRIAVRTAATVAIALVAALAVVLPAHADTYTGIQPTFRTENTFFHCGSTPLSNVNLITDGPTGWNTTPPSGSVTDGNGCSGADPGAERGANQETIYDAQFAGSFTGNLRDLTLHLHSFLLSQARQATTFSVRVWLNIDGVDVTSGGSTGQTVTVTPVSENMGATEDFEISLWNIGFANYVYDSSGNLINVQTGGYATEDGNGETEHTIEVTIDSATATQNSLWAWDTTEVPSGISFNPATLAPAKIKVPTPAPAEQG